MNQPLRSLSYDVPQALLAGWRYAGDIDALITTDDRHTIEFGFGDEAHELQLVDEGSVTYTTTGDAAGLRLALERQLELAAGEPA